MGLIDKALGLAGLAAGGIAAAASLLNNNKKKIEIAEQEFAVQKNEYDRRKTKLVEKVQRGDRGAEKKLRVLEDEFAVTKKNHEARLPHLYRRRLHHPQVLYVRRFLHHRCYPHAGT